MNFIRYNPITGDILNIGWGDAQSVQAEIDSGNPTITYEGVIEWGKWRVNLQTKQVEPIPEK